MRHLHLTLALIAIAALGACRGSAPEKKSPPAPMDPSLAEPGPSEEPPPAPPKPTRHEGTVEETMNAMKYTYLLVNRGEDKVWLAAPEKPVKIGDRITAPPGMLMADFESRTLKRRFERIYFVSGFKVESDPVAAAVAAPPKGPDAAAEPAEVAVVDGVKKAIGGVTIGEIYSRKSALAGQEVAVRGKVVKYVPFVLGTNWIHIQDGTGGKGSNDLTITTKAKAKVGDMVLVRGKVVLDRDLGHGYRYDVLIENAGVEIEK